MKMAILRRCMETRYLQWYNSPAAGEGLCWDLPRVKARRRVHCHLLKQALLQQGVCHKCSGTRALN